MKLFQSICRHFRFHFPALARDETQTLTTTFAVESAEALLLLLPPDADAAEGYYWMREKDRGYCLTVAAADDAVADAAVVAAVELQKCPEQTETVQLLSPSRRCNRLEPVPEHVASAAERFFPEFRGLLGGRVEKPPVRRH